jgi:phospholipid/cholesterol/gamma-HCH transport system substrate-binding protein
MKNSLETRLGLFFALAFLAGIAILEMVGGVDWFSPGYHLNTSFANIRELKTGDPIKMAGVQIGKVEAITLADQRVRVTLKINRNARVRTDSRAALKSPSLLGQQNFVEVSFGATGAQAVEGATLESDEQPDLDTLMVKLDHVAAGVENITKSFSGDTLNNLLGPITDFLKQNNQSFSAIITNAANITGQVAAGKGTVGKLIYEDSLYNTTLATVTNLQAATTDIRQTINDAKAVVAQINAGQGTIGKLVKDDKLYNETSDAMTYAKEILQKINAGKGTVGGLVNDDTMLKNIKVSLQKLDKATEGLEDTGPLSVLGTVAGKLF